MGSASKRCARERTVSQETTAKTMERTRRRRNVRRHSSLWRLSNCARRSETGERASRGEEECLVAPEVCLVACVMRMGEGRLRVRPRQAGQIKSADKSLRYSGTGGEKEQGAGVMVVPEEYRVERMLRDPVRRNLGAGLLQRNVKDRTLEKHKGCGSRLRL